MPKSTRRNFLVSGTAAAAGVLSAGLPVTPLRASGATFNQQPVLQIGIVADAQFADSDTKGTRFYRNSIEKLSTAVEDFNRQELGFCVHLGDLIDHTWKSFDQILKPLAESRHTFHHLLGNHDFDILDEHKPQLHSRLAMPARYYSFAHSGFRFIVLDTNDVSTYAHTENSPDDLAAGEELKRLKAARLPQAQTWNGGLSQTQLDWFARNCRSAAESQQKVIVFAHHPVFPADVHNLWNTEAVLKIIDKNRNIVAWFNGHNHAGDFGVRDGVPFVTVHGMVETAATSSYATADLFPDRIVVTGHDREPSRELVFRTA